MEVEEGRRRSVVVAVQTQRPKSSESDAEKSPETYVPDKSKTLAALFSLFVAWLSNDVALAWIHERVPYESDPLPDIWFSLFPEYQPAIKIAECLVLLSVACALTLIVLHRHRWIVARRAFFVAALCYFGRAVCVSVTQVPVPSRNTYCDPRANETGIRLVVERVARSFSGLGMDVYQRRVLCGDLVYSGHTTVLVLCYSIVERYCPAAYARPSAYLSRLAALIGVVCILLARKHYTLDVLLGYWIAGRVFWIYHDSAANLKRTVQPTLGSDDVRHYGLTEFFWYPLLLYLENDVPSYLPNRFASPPLRLRELFRRKGGSAEKERVVIEEYPASSTDRCEILVA